MERYILKNYLIVKCREKEDKCLTLDELANFPTEEVTPIIKGRWERQYEKSGLLRCSNCGYEYCDYIECVNYCGNCGAKMEV